jgi:hypothetical protein
LADFEILNPNTWPEGDEKHLRYGRENMNIIITK